MFQNLIVQIFDGLFDKHGKKIRAKNSLLENFGKIPEVSLHAVLIKQPKITSKIVCGPGHFLPQKKCIPCPIGTYQFTTHLHSHKCLTCPPFTYNGKLGESACRFCENVTMSTIPVWGSSERDVACSRSILRSSSRISHTFAYLRQSVQLKCNGNDYVFRQFVLFIHIF